MKSFRIRIIGYDEQSLGATFLPRVAFETIDTKGKIAFRPVRFRTEKGVGFPRLEVKFRDGQWRGQTVAA